MRKYNWCRKEFANTTDMLEFINSYNFTSEDFKIFSKRIKKLDDLDILDAKTILYLNKLDTYFVLDNINNNMLNIESSNLNIESYEES